MLDFEPSLPLRRINHREPLLLIGSCFTESIGRKLADAKFDAVFNPAGIVFDPLSVCRHLRDFATRQLYSADDLVNHDHVFHSWQHHSRLSAVDAHTAVEQINSGVATGADALRRAAWCVVTLGTSFHYRLTGSGLSVANCHKEPQTAFAKTMLTTAEIEACLCDAFAVIRSVNPKINVLLTVSPVRHSRDGLVENNRSKARLLEAVHSLVERLGFVHYFPSYELVIDVLRDYRFYNEDMVHPNETATQFVFDKFCATWLDAETNALLPEVRRVLAALRHRPQHPASTSHRLFLQEQFAVVKALAARTPWCDWRNELSYFGHGA